MNGKVRSVFFGAFLFLALRQNPRRLPFPNICKRWQQLHDASIVFKRGQSVENRDVPTQKSQTCSLRTQFGKNVVRLRIAKGLTQENLAEAAGISTRYTQSIEAGKYFPTLRTLSKLRKALDTSWDEMLRGCEG